MPRFTDPQGAQWTLSVKKGFKTKPRRIADPMDPERADIIPGAPFVPNQNGRYATQVTITSPGGMVFEGHTFWNPSDPYNGKTARGLAFKRALDHLRDNYAISITEFHRDRSFLKRIFRPIQMGRRVPRA